MAAKAKTQAGIKAESAQLDRIIREDFGRADTTKKNVRLRMPVSSTLDSSEEEQHQEHHRDHADLTGAAEGDQIVPSYKSSAWERHLQQAHKTFKG